METKLLVSRILGALNRGSASDGAALAAEYNAAIAGVTTRLESAMTAVNDGQTSEAVRIMEDEPRLLDVVSMLEFARLAEWEALCVDNRWAPPEKIDKTLLEKVVLFAEGNEVVEPLLKMYRKAMRTHNVKLSVRALRRLVERDKSQDWTKELSESEETLKKALLDDFLSAQKTENADEALRIATILFEDTWVEPVKGAEFLPATALYTAERRKERQARVNDLSVALAECLADAWSRSRAKSLVVDIEADCTDGVALTDEQRELVEQCRARYEEEDAAEAAALEAQRVAAEVAARKKLLIRVVSSVAAVLTAAFAAGAFYVVKTSHERGCQSEIAILEGLLQGVSPIEKTSAEITRVQTDYPKIWADARVAAFAERLASLKEAWTVRTNAIAQALAKVEDIKAKSWPDEFDGVAKEALEEIKGKIRAEDQFAVKRYEAVRDEFAEVFKRKEGERQNKADAFGTTMMTQIKTVAERLEREFMTADLERQLVTLKATMEEWEKHYSKYGASSTADFESEREKLLVNEKHQQEAQAAWTALRDATSVEEVEKARKELVTKFSEYGTVKSWPKVWATVKRVQAVFASESSEMKAMRETLGTETSEGDFKDFKESILGFREMDAFYSLYGVRETHQGWYNLFAKGKPVINEVTRGGKRAYVVTGNLLLAKKMEVKDEYEWTLSSQTHDILPTTLNYSAGVIVNSGVRTVRTILTQPAELLVYSKEFRTLYSVVADNEKLTQAELAGEFIKLMSEHLRMGTSNEWCKAELSKKPYFSPGRHSAYARVQMLDRYVGWLQDLHRFGDDAPYAKQMRECAKLAKPVHVDNVEDSISWLCTNSEEVRERNAKCVEFLKKFPRDFIQRLNEWNRTRGKIARHLGYFSLHYAGKFMYDPTAFADYPGQTWFVVSDEHKGASLYVLREGKKEGTPVLKRALDYSGTTWRRANGMESAFIPGEPLFKVMELGKAVQPEGVLQETLKETDADTAKAFCEKIPYFEL